MPGRRGGRHDRDDCRSGRNRRHGRRTAARLAAGGFQAHPRHCARRRPSGRDHRRRGLRDFRPGGGERRGSAGREAAQAAAQVGRGRRQPRHRDRSRARNQGGAHHRQQLHRGRGVHDWTDDLRVTAHSARSFPPAERTLAGRTRAESVPAVGQDHRTGRVRRDRQVRREAALRIRLHAAVQQASSPRRRGGAGAWRGIREAAGSACPGRRGLAALPADRGKRAD